MWTSTPNAIRIVCHTDVGNLKIIGESFVIFIGSGDSERRARQEQQALVET
jgi:hypothetical protein